MKKHKPGRKKGSTWVETNVQELVGLSDEELVVVEFRAALAVALHKTRTRMGLTQEELAEMVGSTQAHVSKMEAGQQSVTIDRMIRALAAIGVSRQAIVRALGKAA